jgi:hypothetical protein
VTAASGHFAGAGPAKGLCTVSCAASNSVCNAFGTSAVCHDIAGGESFCFEGCAFGPPSLNVFDPNKCHGRPEMACSPLVGASGQIAAVCLPSCNSDADCGGGLFCHPSDGLCRLAKPAGKPTGESCLGPDAGTGECQGMCLPMESTSGTAANVCSASCTLGALPACGWDGPTSGQPAPAGCLFVPSQVIDNGGAGVGDIGYCGRFCNCNDDCAPGLVCESFGDPQLESFYQKKGYCAPADGSSGIPCN